MLKPPVIRETRNGTPGPESIGLLVIFFMIFMPGNTMYKSMDFITIVDVIYFPGN